MKATIAEGGTYRRNNSNSSGSSSTEVGETSFSVSISGSVRNLGDTRERCTREGRDTTLAEGCGSELTGPAQEVVVQTACVGLPIDDGSRRCEKKRQPIVQPTMFAAVKQRKRGCAMLLGSHTDGGKVQEGTGIQTAWVKNTTGAFGQHQRRRQVGGSTSCCRGRRVVQSPSSQLKCCGQFYG